jgi:hypothetical protein
MTDYVLSGPERAVLGKIPTQNREATGQAVEVASKEEHSVRSGMHGGTSSTPAALRPSVVRG